MAIGTVPCLLWKWCTWWVVLRLDDTRAVSETLASVRRPRGKRVRTQWPKLAMTPRGLSDAPLGARGKGKHKPFLSQISMSCWPPLPVSNYLPLWCQNEEVEIFLSGKKMRGITFVGFSLLQHPLIPYKIQTKRFPKQKQKGIQMVKNPWYLGGSPPQGSKKISPSSCVSRNPKNDKAEE